MENEQHWYQRVKGGVCCECHTGLTVTVEVIDGKEYCVDIHAKEKQHGHTEEIS